MRSVWSPPFVFLLVASIAASDTITTAPVRIAEDGDPVEKENNVLLIGTPSDNATKRGLDEASKEQATKTFGQDRLSQLRLIDTLLRKYDRRATPTNEIGQPTDVGCELFIRSFGSISERTMDYQVDLYLRQHWEDPRLNHQAISEALDLNDPKLVQAIWKPEVYFPNAKEGEFQYVTVPNVLLRIKPDGQILYMLRLKMTFSCMMELFKYPLDVQVCTMEIASFSKTTRELLLKWNTAEAVDLSNDLKLPQFTMERVETGFCEEGSLIGNYSCLVAKFHLSRSVGFHMVQTYVPSVLIVVISWVSFWMDVDSVAGRTTLGVTTLLTVSSKSAGISADTPQVSYIKAIDVWMNACTAFIFAALIEFTFVNYWYRKQQAARLAGGGVGGSFGGGGFGGGGYNPVYGGGREGDVVNGDGIELQSRLFGDVVGEDGEAGTNGKVTVAAVSDTAAVANEEGDGIVRVHTLLNSDEGGTANHKSPTGSKGGSVGLVKAVENIGGGVGRAYQLNRRQPTSYGIRIDEACRVLFPLNFICFNVIYWWYYSM